MKSQQLVKTAGAVVFLGVIVMAEVWVRPTRVLAAHHEVSGCSTDTLEGDYIWSFSRLTVATGARRDALGVMTFDGAGNLSAVVTFNDDGVSTVRAPRTGIYNVDTDCTGTLILDGVNDWDLVLTRDAREGYVIQTAPRGLKSTGFLRQRDGRKRHEGSPLG